MLFGVNVHGFVEEVRNDTTGKYDFLREEKPQEKQQ